MLLLNLSILASLLGSVHGIRRCMIQCPMVSNIRNGRVHCGGINYGHACYFDCNEGYTLVGNWKIRCLRSGQWDGSYPQCVAKECALLTMPPNSKGFICTNGRKVGSFCLLNCDETRGYARFRNQFTRCSADKTWTNVRMKCQDIEAPQIQNCPSQTVVKSKDPSAELTYVRWEKPITVTDNSGERIHIIANGAEANANSGVFTEGVTLIKLTAQDSAKNTASSCSFIVRIETVRCDPPKMDDQYLETPGCVDYREGQSCTLQCYLALELVGPRVITCKKDGSSTKGYWSYGQRDSPPVEKPYCKVHNCTELRAPNHGAISCDNWELGRTCSISCQQDYDIPESVYFKSSFYYCQTRTGRWNNDHVPDCVYREYGQRNRMEAYSYFDKGCWGSTLMIKSNFLMAFNRYMPCQREELCTMENVNVRCGEERDYDFWGEPEGWLEPDDDVKRGQVLVNGGWSRWYDWSECSASCAGGVQTRFRFCTNPPPSLEGEPCHGSDGQTRQCNVADCPVCDVSTLVLGKGTVKACTRGKQQTSCSISCELGKVLPDRPSNYICTSGEWTPRKTMSCTDPVTPFTTGISYTVVYGHGLTSQPQVQTLLNRVGHNFSCARDNTCDVEVTSSVCSPNVPACHKHGGSYYGSIIVKKSVPRAPINVVDIQKSDNPYIKRLLEPWHVFSYKIDEHETPFHRPLEMQIEGDQLKVFQHNNTDQAVTVNGQFGEIMKTWKLLDNINWEVRNVNYTAFEAPTKSKPVFLSAVQILTCPPGAVGGGVFCMKCPPGKYYVNEECKWCAKGLYQDLPGQLACKVCPAFQTTEDIGSSDVSECKDTDVSELHILLGLTSPNIGVLDMTDLKYRQMSMTPTFTSNVDYMAYNPRDKIVFFSTQYPSTIGRVGYSGQNKTELLTFPDGTVVTGLDVDIGSNLLFYMTNQGVLAVYHIDTAAQQKLLSDLPSSNGLVLDQEFGIYWMETASIRYMHYGDEKPRTLYTDSQTIWGLTINFHDKRLMWQSAARLRSSNMDGSDPQTLSLNFSHRFGATEEYFFTIIKEGRTQKLMRENRDRTAHVSIHAIPAATSRIKVINTTAPHKVDQICLPSRSDCEQACLPLNTTSRRCFCGHDFTLQSDLKSCRRDFSVGLETTDYNLWYRPNPKQYSIPPSKTLRFKVKACNSVKLALAKSGRELYLLQMGYQVNIKTMIRLMKYSTFRPKVLLQERETTLLDCNQFKTFWITWKMDEVRRTQAIKVGYGSIVGSHMLLNVADAFPYTVNFLQFGVGINSTAHWQI